MRGHRRTSSASSGLLWALDRLEVATKNGNPWSPSTVADLLNAKTVLGPNTTDPRTVCHVDKRKNNHCAEQQLRVNPRQDTETADELDDSPPGVVQHSEDQLTHAAGILPKNACRTAGFELMDAIQR